MSGTSQFPPGHFDSSALILGKKQPKELILGKKQPKEMDLTVKPEGWGSWLKKKAGSAVSAVTGGIGSVASAAGNTSAGQVLKAKVAAAASDVLANSSVQAAMEAGLKLGVKGVAYLVKSDPKILKESQAALEQLGLVGPKALGLKALIDDGVKQLLNGKSLNPTIKKLIDNSQEEVKTLKDTAETVVTKAIANLAEIMTKRAASKGNVYAPASYAELMQDILAYFSEKAQGHFIGVNATCTMHEQIAKIESSLLTNEQKQEKLAEVFTPLTNEMIKAAFPKGLSAAGLGWVASFGGDYILSDLPSQLAKYYAKTMEPVADTAKLKAELDGSNEGQILLQATQFGAKAIFGSHPTIKNLESFGAPIFEGMVTRLAFNLAGGDKATPLQSALKRITDILVGFYTTSGAPLKTSFQKQLQLQKELAKCRALPTPTDPAQSTALAADISRLEGLIKGLEQARIQFFKKIAKDLWDAFGLDNERLVKTILDVKAKTELVEETIPNALCKACTAQILANGGLLHWIVPEQSSIDDEIAKLNLGSAVTSMAEAFSQLLLSPAPALLDKMSEQIADGILIPLNSAMPLFSQQLNAHIKSIIIAKLKALAANPQATDPLWKFLQANIKGIALELVKSLAVNKEQAELIRAIGAMPAGGTVQGVIDLMKGIAANLKSDIEAFHAQHRTAIAAARTSMPANPNPADFQKFNEIFAPLRDQLLLKTGLNELFAKHGRLDLFGLENEIRKHLLTATAELYTQYTQPKAAAAPAQQTAAPATQAAALAQLTTPTAANPATTAPAMDRKELMDILGHLAEIIGRHFNGLGDPLHPTVSLPERIAAIESSKLDNATKKKEIADLFRPLILELNKDKRLIDFLIPLLQSVIAQKAPAGMQSIISTISGAFGGALVPMLPSMLAFVYPMLSGSCGDAAMRKQLLNDTNEGKIILAGVQQGTEMLLTPLLNSLMQTLSGDKTKDFSKDPLLKHLEGFGKYLADSILNNFILNLAGNDAKNPLKSLITNLQNLLGALYKNNIVPLKKVYQEQAEHQKLLEQCDPNDAAEIARLKGLLEADQQAKLALLKPVAEALWKAGKLAQEPPFNLIPDMAINLLPGILCSAFDSIFKDQPGVWAWIDPPTSNAAARTELSNVQNGEICEALAGVVVNLTVEPAKELVVNKSDAIAEAVVKGLGAALTLSDDLKGCLRQVIADKLIELAHLNPLLEFFSGNIEGLILDLFKGMTSKQAALGKAIFKMAAGVNPKDEFNPLEAIAGELLDQAENFQAVHGAAVEKDYLKDLTTIRQARADLEKARAALPAHPSDAEKLAFKAQKDALKQLEKEFYKRFQPLVDSVLSSTGFDKLLEKEGRLGVFGIDTLIHEQLLVLCADIYHQSVNPFVERDAINHNLSIALFDSHHAAKIALGKDEKAEKLRKAGIKLDGADIARQKEILDAADATETTAFVGQLQEMLAHIIETETFKFLATGGEDLASEINSEVFQKGIKNPATLKILGDGIQNLAKSKSKGAKAAIQYYHAILIPALSKGLINLFHSTRQTLEPAQGEFKKEMLPVNIILRLFESMHTDVAELEKEKDFQPLREEIWKQEALIRQKNSEIADAKAKAASGITVDVKALEDELKALQLQLGELNGKMGVLFQPLTKKLLGYVTGDKEVSDPAHPLHDATFLPEKTRTTIWKVLIPKCLGLFLAAHYHHMNPQIEPLQDQLRAISGNNKLNEFCIYMSKVIRDITPKSLTDNFGTMSSDLTDTILNALSKAPAGAPEYIKNLHLMISKHQGVTKQILGSIFKAVGSSKLDVFRFKLWPALQKFSLPVLLQLITKIALKLKQIDTPQVRTKLTVDFLKLLNAHAKTANAATTATNHAHPHEVPAHQMFDQFKKAGQLHPHIDQVMQATPEEEAAIHKAQFTEFGKQFFATIGFTKEDLPLDDLEKGVGFDLLIDELAPLTIGMMFDNMAPGKTRGPIEGDLYNAMVITLLDEYKKRAEEAKTQTPAGKTGSLESTIPGISALLANQAKKKQDAAQDKMDEELGNLVVNEIRARIPDKIAHEPLIIRPLLAASAKDLGAIIREKWCENGSLLGSFSWLGGIMIKALFNGNYDDKLDKFVPDQRDPEFVPISSSPQKVAETSKTAHAKATKAGSELIVGGITEWFNGILDSISLAINTAMRDFLRFIDKKSNSKKMSEALINGIRNAVWYIGWGLFYVTIIPWVISLIAKHAYIPNRVAANVTNIQKEMHGLYNRNFFYHAADLMRGQPYKAAPVAPLVPAKGPVVANPVSPRAAAAMA